MDDDTTSVTAALFGLAGFEVLAAAEAGGEVELLVQTTADLVGCPRCGAVARAKDRRPSWVRDLPLGGRGIRRELAEEVLTVDDQNKRLQRVAELAMSRP